MNYINQKKQEAREKADRVEFDGTHHYKEATLDTLIETTIKDTLQLVLGECDKEHTSRTAWFNRDIKNLVSYHKGVTAIRERIKSLME